MRWLTPLSATVALGAVLSLCSGAARGSGPHGMVKVQVDSVGGGPEAEAERYRRLTDEDFEHVADELGVEVAAIKAVVSIEAGAAMKGFWAPGVPVINFDRTMYRKYAAKAGGGGAKGETVPKGLSGYALREWTQLINARKSNARAANLGTFWGMFQIGGFNYKVCGCESVDEFVRLMSYSELEQLELFAAFLRNTGYVSELRALNWAGFARKYNGPSYARRGYHTRMAKAYAKFKAEESNRSRFSRSEGITGRSLKLLDGAVE